MKEAREAAWPGHKRGRNHGTMEPTTSVPHTHTPAPPDGWCEAEAPLHCTKRGGRRGHLLANASLFLQINRCARTLAYSPACLWFHILSFHTLPFHTLRPHTSHSRPLRERAKTCFYFIGVPRAPGAGQTLSYTHKRPVADLALAHTPRGSDRLPASSTASARRRLISYPLKSSPRATFLCFP